MAENARFIFTTFAALVLAWLFSGDRFLDSIFEMVDLGRFDDIVISGVVILEEGKASLGLPDLFSALRGALHGGLGL